MKLSPHFTLAECIASNVAKNTGGEMLEQQSNPNEKIKANLMWICSKMELPRVALGIPFKATSVWRCLLLNRALGSSDRSAHVAGLAMDIVLSERSIANFYDIGLILNCFDCNQDHVNNNFRLFVFCCLHAEQMKIKQIIHEKGTLGKPEWIHIGFYTPFETYTGTKITVFDGKNYTHRNDVFDIITEVS